MRTLRVVIVDGDPLARRRLGRALEGWANVDVVGASGLGTVAAEKVGRLQPDVVLLGVGTNSTAAWETLGLLHVDRPELPVLVVGPEVHRGSPTALDAIHHGASGCVSCRIDDADALRASLLPRLRGLGDATPPTPPPRAAGRARTETGGRVEAVVIGSSTGGPNGLVEVIRSVPADLPAPVLIVQHMPAGFIPGLSERLHALGAIPVREAADGALARPGTAWVAPGGRHLEVVRDGGSLRMRLVDTPPENSCRPSVDVLFRSAARALGGRVLGVVLTGMGLDGLRGCRAIREAGGTVLVQDEATSVVWGMPGCVAEAGLAHAVLPIERIGPEVVRRATAARPTD